MYKTVSSFSIGQFSSSKTYEKYSVVRNTFGYLFVSVSDGNNENADTILGAASGTLWLNFEGNWDIFSVWKPSTGLGFDLQIGAIAESAKSMTQYEVVDMNIGANYTVSWGSLTYPEYKSLLSFLEYKNQVGCYISNPFGKFFKVLFTAVTKSFNGYNNYSLAASVQKTRFYDSGVTIT